VILIAIAIAGSVLVVLAVFFALITICVQAEDRHTKGILVPPPTILAAATRRVTGLYVRQPAIPSGQGYYWHQPSARAALDATPEGGENSWPFRCP
jgi:hypothetical protein